MIDLFVEGGVLMMSIISLFLIGMFVFIFTSKSSSDQKGKRPFQRTIQVLARMALATGVLSFLIGMFSGFSVLAKTDLSPGVLIGGTRVAMISLIYALLVYLIGQIIILVNQRRRF